jgi:hypothetical protein
VDVPALERQLSDKGKQLFSTSLEVDTAPDYEVARYALLREQLVALQGTGPLNKPEMQRLKQQMQSLREAHPEVERSASDPVDPVPLGTGGGELLPYEKEFVRRGIMTNVTHPGSSSAWLVAASRACIPASHTLVYRPMAGRELSFLMSAGNLPASLAALPSYYRVGKRA